MTTKKTRIPSATHEKPAPPSWELPEPEPEISEKPSSLPLEGKQAKAPAGYKIYFPPMMVAVAPSGHKLYSSDGEHWFDEAGFYSR